MTPQPAASEQAAYPILSSAELASYRARIGLPPAASAKPEDLHPDLATLAALHRAHALAIPFENLSIYRGDQKVRGERPIRLDLPSLLDKLVHRKRGGYCFEQNSLFLAVLRTLGFAATAFEARVRAGASRVLARTHMVLCVEVADEPWLCDVGFGGDGLIEPVPWGDGEISHGCRTYRLIPEHFGEAARGDEPALRVLQARGLPGVDGWGDLYAIEPRPVLPVDLEMANWYTSTFPESKFVTTLTAQRITPDVRYALRGRTLTIVRGQEGAAPEVEVRELTDEAEVERVLREVMGLP